MKQMLVDSSHKKIDNFYFNQNRKNDIKTIKSERLKNIINQLK